MRIIPMLSALGIFLGIVASAAPAHADPVPGTRNLTGASCVVAADDTASLQRYQTTARGVIFRPGATGTIRLICQAPQSGTISSVNLIYKDGDGKGTRARVVLNVMFALSKSPTPNLIAGADSNWFATTNYESIGANLGSPHEVWPDDVVYYEVIMTRSVATLPVELLGVQTVGSF